MPTTIVVGAGWAGLNCAYELAKGGHKVLVLEAAPQIGGRARGIKFRDHIVDNGQHIGIGAYHTLRALLRELGQQEHKLFKILPLELNVYGTSKIHLKLPKLPAPLHILAGFLTIPNLPMTAKIQIIKFAWQLHRLKFTLQEDCTVLELLQNYHQSSFVIEHIWQPIALAAMSTPVAHGSAQVFLNILRQVFSTVCEHSNWYLPAVDLSTLLPNYLAQHLQKSGQKIICNQAIKKVYLHNDQITVTSNTDSWQADQLVLATPPGQTSRLLQEFTQLQEMCNDLNTFCFEPITTAYFLFDQPLRLPYPMYGIINATCQWIFDRAFVNQPNILSAVITGKTATIECILQDIYRHFPHLPNPIATKIICEKRAAFSCAVAIQKLRPQPRTAIKNLWLTGDYLQTGLPATLEGALLSGKQTAGEILREVISPRSNQNC